MNKFKTNSFAKKYKRELETADLYDNIDESVRQIKSWNNYGVGMQVSFLWVVTLLFIIGVVVCSVIIHQNIITTMELSKQLTSLELSQKLKSLGVKQESYFFWFDIKKELYPSCCKGWVYNKEHKISAFTVAQLGEMLPANFVLPYKRDIDGKVWGCYPVENREELYLVEADTEADARGAMLAFLIENKLITL